MSVSSPRPPAAVRFAAPLLAASARSTLAAIVLTATVATTPVVAQGASPPAGEPVTGSFTLTPGREFAAGSLVHRPLPRESRVLPRSEAYVRDLADQVRQHGVTVNIDRYAPPIFIAPPDAPLTRVRAARSHEPGWSFAPLQAQWLAVPVPPGFRPAEGTDRDAIIVQPSTGRYWEFWGLERSRQAGRATAPAAAPVASPAASPEARPDSGWQAHWGGMIGDLGSNPGYFPTTREGHTFGVAATSLALLAGLMTIAEQQAGEINHVLHIALPRTRAGVHVWPAQRTDGADTRPDAIAQGTLFRLPASLDLSTMGLDPYALMIARAVQRHGMLVRDTAGVVAFYAQNPLTSDPARHPYYGPGGILRCPNGRPEPVCYADGFNRLRGFPWDKLQAIEPDGAP